MTRPGVTNLKSRNRHVFDDSAGLRAVPPSAAAKRNHHLRLAHACWRTRGNRGARTRLSRAVDSGNPGSWPVDLRMLTLM
nr:hypothetical protein [Kibdelosporangium sp. MJ126-NF4]CTQ90692.1 hypothetical protein [Kibdelosporangium sp. MJ126-NF4]